MILSRRPDPQVVLQEAHDLAPVGLVHATREAELSPRLPALAARKVVLHGGGGQQLCYTTVFQC